MNSLGQEREFFGYTTAETHLSSFGACSCPSSTGFSLMCCTSSSSCSCYLTLLPTPFLSTLSFIPSQLSQVFWTSCRIHCCTTVVVLSSPLLVSHNPASKVWSCANCSQICKSILLHPVSLAFYTMPTVTSAITPFGRPLAAIDMID